MRPTTLVLWGLAVALMACGSRRRSAALEQHGDCETDASETDTSETGADTTSVASTGDPDGSSGSTGETTTTGLETTGGSTAEAPDTGTGASETTGETSGGPTAACGNGVLEPFGAEPEECDDGNQDADDGCGMTCALDRRAFVTSIKYQAGALQSLYLADAICANRADDQGLPDPLKYRAWLSDSTIDARDRFVRGRGRLILVNGLVLADSWAALLAGELEQPFEVTEKSETYHGGVWTGTRPDGTAVPGAEHCDNWASDWYLMTGHYGYSDRTTPEWTLSAQDDNPSACAANYALYCLQTL